jgi:MFS family permease
LFKSATIQLFPKKETVAFPDGCSVPARPARGGLAEYLFIATWKMGLGEFLSRNTIIACVSNLSTAYNLQVISLAQVFVENQYCGGDTDACHGPKTFAATSCLVGAIFGQLTFGYVGDCLGRARALQLTMALSVLGAFLSAFAMPFDRSKPETVFYCIALTRFILGLGVGGVYPLSATIASESAKTAAKRGTTASIVFSMQGVGCVPGPAHIPSPISHPQPNPAHGCVPVRTFLTVSSPATSHPPRYVIVPLLGLVLVALFHNPHDLADHGPDGPGYVWRLLLGLGALPGVLLAPFKAIETSKRHSVTPTTPVPNAVAADATPLPPPKPALTLMQALCQKQYWGKILGCAGGWFFFDITFYVRPPSSHPHPISTAPSTDALTDLSPPSLLPS